MQGLKLRVVFGGIGINLTFRHFPYGSAMKNYFRHSNTFTFFGHKLDAIASVDFFGRVRRRLLAGTNFSAEKMNWGFRKDKLADYLHYWRRGNLNGDMGYEGLEGGRKGLNNLFIPTPRVARFFEL